MFYFTNPRFILPHDDLVLEAVASSAAYINIPDTGPQLDQQPLTNICNETPCTLCPAIDMIKSAAPKTKQSSLYGMPVTRCHGSSNMAWAIHPEPCTAFWTAWTALASGARNRQVYANSHRHTLALSYSSPHAVVCNCRCFFEVARYTRTHNALLKGC